MFNISVNVTTTSGVVAIPNTVKSVIFQNTGDYPITIRSFQDGVAVFGEGIILPIKYSSYQMIFDRDFWIGDNGGKTSAISLGGPSTLAITYSKL